MARKRQQAQAPTANDGRVFSVRLPAQLWLSWKAYANTINWTKGGVSDLTTKALQEYMNRHKLNADQLREYQYCLERWGEQYGIPQEQAGGVD